MPPIDYSKWDFIDDEDVHSKDGEPSVVRASPAVGSPEFQAKMDNHNQSMSVIAGWIREADPRATAEATTNAIKFITTQHHGIHDHNISRHQEIVAFMESAKDSGTVPSLHTMLALARLAKQRSEDADSATAATGQRVLLVAIGAINTLAACEAEGGARSLFDTLLREVRDDA